MKKMADFDKESFKKDVINNVKNLFRKTIDEATQEQVFQAVSYAVKDHIIDRWMLRRRHTRRRMQRLFTTCLWSSLWAVHLVII